MSLIKKLFASPDPLKALGLTLEPGAHTYLFFYDETKISKQAVETICGHLQKGGINSVFVGCTEPTKDIAYVRLDGVSPEVEVPSPQAGVGE